MSNSRELRIETLLGDLTEQDTDAIVNAANPQLQAGGGVCGAIFAKAGEHELQAACDRIGGCPVGQARVTPGFGIPVKGIIHAVGPVYRGGTHGEAELLASAWRSAIEVAEQQGYRSVAFPSISTGIYGYPLDQAASVVGTTLIAFAAEHVEAVGSLELVRIVLRDPATKAHYDEAIFEAKTRR